MKTILLWKWVCMMEEIKIMSDVGYHIGRKAKLHEFELLRLLEMIKYDQYHDFFMQVSSIARSVKVSIPDQIFHHDYDTFERYIHALWEGMLKSSSTLKFEVS